MFEWIVVKFAQTVWFQAVVSMFARYLLFVVFVFFFFVAVFNYFP